jgi:hypothetical protein
MDRMVRYMAWQIKHLGAELKDCLASPHAVFCRSAPYLARKIYDLRLALADANRKFSAVKVKDLPEVRGASWTLLPLAVCLTRSVPDRVRAAAEAPHQAQCAQLLDVSAWLPLATATGAHDETTSDEEE